jgi:GAF domain-containing protein
MEGVIDKLMDSTGAQVALIRLQDKARNGFVIAQREFPEEYLKAVEVTKPGSAVDMVFKSGEPVISPDIGADPRLKGKFQLKVGLRSCAILPLKVRGETRGVMHLASGDLGYFKEDQRDHLMAVARQMGIAVRLRCLA